MSSRLSSRVHAMEMGFAVRPHEPLPKMLDVLRWKMRGKEVRPRDYRVQPLAAVPNALADFDASAGALSRVFWIGHASFLLQLDSARFVIDPIFGRAGGLVPRVTARCTTGATDGFVGSAGDARHVR